MKLNERIDLLVKLGDYLSEKGEFLRAVMHRTHYHNLWFTIENQLQATTAIAQQFLQRDALEKWAAHYHIDENIQAKTVGLIMAGNIPMVGFHDLIAVFIAGHRAMIKLSDKDQYLLPHLIDWMEKKQPEIKNYFKIVPTLKDFDAVIATGSNNSARYFEAYFGKHPNIIRKNRNSIAVLSGKETVADFIEFGKDIFQYYGLGCRNVSKLFLPKGYDFQPLLESLHTNYKKIISHSKYKNNFDYNYAIFMLNKVHYESNGCILMIEQEAIISRIATLHYEYYDEVKDVQKYLRTNKDAIQCIVSTLDLGDIPSLPFGQAQQPSLMDYPDGVDVLNFLLSLN